jgi:hypothetical protein
MQIGRRIPDFVAVVKCGATAAAMILAGCSSPGAVGVDPESAAARAMELYDANKDGALDAEELKKSPSIAAAQTAYDANGDGRIETGEISQRLARLFAGKFNLAEVDITVTVDGQPLSGATVQLQPAEFVGSGMEPAKGVTDATGTVRPTIAAEQLPAEFRSSPLVQFGPYVVEVTHPERALPARYNSASELGMDVDPTSRSGLTTGFALSTK